VAPPETRVPIASLGWVLPAHPVGRIRRRAQFRQADKAKNEEQDTKGDQGGLACFKSGFVDAKPQGEQPEC